MGYATLAEAEQHIDMLRAQIAAIGLVPIEVPSWGRSFSLNQVILIQALQNAYPNYLTRWQLEEVIPRRRDNSHYADRNENVIGVMVSHIRNKAGRAAIENMNSVGYRLGADFFQRLNSG